MAEAKFGDLRMTEMLLANLTSSHFIKDEEELRHVCLQGGFIPETDRFAVLVLQIERWSNVFSTDAQWLEATRDHFFVLTNMLQELLEQDNIPLISEKDYQLVAVVNLCQEWDSFRSTLEIVLSQMMEILETEFNISVTIAISDLCHGISALPRAYMQAREVLSYNSYLELEAQVSCYGDLYGQQMSMISSELTALDKKLISRVQLLDAVGTKYVLHEMIDREFIRSRPSIQIWRVRMGGICSKILDTLDEFRGIVGDRFYYDLNPAPRIVETRNLSELTGNMDEIFDAILQKRNASEQEPKPQWVDRMTVYIEENYMNENLGLTEVAEAFGITPSYATRVYKQYTSHGIYETIQFVRLAAAKNLMHTDKSMKEIAQLVGYTSFLSMNRAFKKYEGATPTQFRTQ